MSVQGLLTTYAATDVSGGTALANGNDYNYTEAVPGSVVFGTGLGAVTVTGYNATNGQVTFQLGATGNLVTYTGTVIGNTQSSVLISTTINIPGLAAITDLYLTNPGTAQPGLALSASVPNEATAVVYVACYCRGTLIRTPTGERPVEELQAGDLVHSLNGGVVPVRWIGTRSYAGRFLRTNPALRPVRFKAGSLGDGLPVRDLLVSAKHSMLIDGVLVPAELLVNDTTIVVEAGLDVVEYFHVELPDHDALWAEGVLSESFVDDGSRGMFHNADSFLKMYPDAADTAAEFFAPRVEDGAVLDAIRTRLGAMPAEARAAA